MQRTRPFTTQRIYGMGFILIVMAIIFGIHLTFVFLVWGPKLWGFGALSVLFVYHVFFSNLLLSFYQCIMTDPGVVPPNWGFYMGDETKRRRYCKMCNVWKPDRTHHCSICNRCILNMDHHCPWINNCVGFYNRKFFIQLLSYVYLSLWIVVMFTVPDLWNRFWVLTSAPHLMNRTWYVIFSALVGIAFCMSVLLICTLTNFIRFHIRLVMENYTTIENLEREEGAKSKFDIGRRRNWEQVFGSNAWLWWLPMHTQASRPIGDGVRWRVHYTRVIDEDEELPADEDGMSQASRLLQQGSTARSGGSNLRGGS
uniref:Palmitoyltransferase n=1 Tax=Alexandrium catenella TaxID=2925 RepID=A0A7S1RAW0_ALECA